jgi:hypothetical protein
MLKKLIFALALVLAGVNTANAEAVSKVLLCHATSADKNPYVFIEVAPTAVEAQLSIGSLIAKQLPDGSYACEVTEDPGDPI